MNELSDCCEANVYHSNNGMAICSDCKEWCEPIEMEDE